MDPTNLKQPADGEGFQRTLEVSREWGTDAEKAVEELPNTAYAESAEKSNH